MRAECRFLGNVKGEHRKLERHVVTISIRRRFYDYLTDVPLGLLYDRVHDSLGDVDYHLADPEAAAI